MRRLATANLLVQRAGRAAWVLLRRAGHVLWVNAATVWLCIASVVLVLGFVSLRNEQQTARRLARQAHVLAVQTHVLSEQNKARLADIQRSRVASCIHNYESFHKVFDPFFPPAAKRTAKVHAQLRKFNRIIAHQVAGCARQVQP